MNKVQRLAQFCQAMRYESIPPDVLEKARLLIIHICANLVAGRGHRFGQIIGDYVVTQGGEPDVTLVASRGRYPLANVILAHCGIAHSLELDDTHNESCTHTGAAIVPAALAVAQKADASGKDFIAAVVLGVEITARVGTALNPTALYAKGYHPSSLSVPFGVAATAGRLQRLGEDQMVNAFGLAGVQSSGLLCASEKGAMSWYFQYGRAAQSGFYAAHFAQNGITAPEDIFEGRRGLTLVHGPQADMARLTSGLAEIWALNGLSFKMHSCLHFGQASCDALLKVLEEEKISYSDVDTIRLHLPTTAFDIVDNKSYPSSRLAAQTSPRYLMAVATLDRKVTPAQFTPERLSSSKVRELAERVQVVADTALDNLFPSRWPAIVDVVTRDGRRYSCEVRNARGDADNPPTLGEIKAKFLDLVDGQLSSQNAQRFLALIDDLESLPNLQPLASVLEDVVSS